MQTEENEKEEKHIASQAINFDKDENNEDRVENCAQHAQKFCVFLNK